MVMVGFVTLVMSRVTSVVSESSFLGFDENVFSSPMVPGSSGALPGHSSTTRGSSAKLPPPVQHKSAATSATFPFMGVPSLSDSDPSLVLEHLALDDLMDERTQ